jgi:hypothetical protein
MHTTFIAFQTPHGWLLVVAFILAICAALPLKTERPVNWFGWSWVFFVASCLFG